MADLAACLRSACVSCYLLLSCSGLCTPRPALSISMSRESAHTRARIALARRHAQTLTRTRHLKLCSTQHTHLRLSAAMRSSNGIREKYSSRAALLANTVTFFLSLKIRGNRARGTVRKRCQGVSRREGGRGREEGGGRREERKRTTGARRVFVAGLVCSCHCWVPREDLIGELQGTLER